MVTDEISKNWGGRLRALLKKQRNIKQLALANAMGVEESTISRWLSGGNIKVGHLIELADFLDVSVDWLIMGRGSPYLHKATNEDRDILQSLPQDIKEDLHKLVRKLGDSSQIAD